MGIPHILSILFIYICVYIYISIYVYIYKYIYIMETDVHTQQSYG